MKLYDYEVDCYMGVEPASIADLQMRSGLLRKNLEERSAQGWRFVSVVTMGSKSQSLVFEREAKNLEWKKVGIYDAYDAENASSSYNENIVDGWFEHSRVGTEVTFFRKKTS